jgi:small subunit ribosomal protein S21
MIIIEVQGGKDGLEKALKKFKRKFDKIGITKELRRRKEFTKPSVERRNEIKKAKWRQKKLDELQ